MAIGTLERVYNNPKVFYWCREDPKRWGRENDDVSHKYGVSQSYHDTFYQKGNFSSLPAPFIILVAVDMKDAV